MILTDREIRISIEAGSISIDPAPDPSSYSSTSIDLTLSPSIKVFNKNVPGVIVSVDPHSEGFSALSVLNQLAKDQTIDQHYDLNPNTLILGWTKERVNLRHTARVAARVEGKSSLARLGLAVHITAPTIHAGFQGQIQLEIINHGPAPIRLRPGMKVCQLIFEQTLGVPDKGYSGQFSDQGSPNKH